MSTLKVNTIVPESGDTVNINDVTVNTKLDLTDAEVVGLDRPGKVLQVKSFTLTDPESVVAMPVKTFFDTGLTLSITPSSVNSKIMVFIDMSMTGSDTLCSATIKRNGTPILLGSTPGIGYASGKHVSGTAQPENVSMSVLDNPGTVSAVTYTAGVASGQAGGSGSPFWINQPKSGVTAEYMNQQTSTITLMEIAE